MPEEMDPDAALMLRVKQGDTAAFEELVEKYKQPITNLLYRNLRDATEAEDLAQNVFIQVYKSADRYRADAKFSTWLYTIARNLCLNEIRRRSRHPADSLDQMTAPDGEHTAKQFPDKNEQAAGEKMLRSELESKVEQALSELPENQRNAMLLYQQQDLSYDEISEVMNCSLSATKSLIHRARETLKAKLKPYLKTGDWQAENE
ncbi:MAG: RNA polymerase sigma factor [Verrucomicrobiales bacterium]